MADIKKLLNEEEITEADKLEAAEVLENLRAKLKKDNIDYDERLDVASPNFDKDYWLGYYKAAIEDITNLSKKNEVAAIEMLKPGALREKHIALVETLNELQKASRPLYETLVFYPTTANGEMFNSLFNGYLEISSLSMSLAKALTGGLNIERFAELFPYLEQELEKPQYKDIKIFDIDEENEYIPTPLYLKAMEAAKLALKAGGAPQIHSRKVDKLAWPVDKINSSIWRLYEHDTAGQMGKLPIAMEKRGSKKEINTVYSIDFEALPPGVHLTKKLTQYDKRVYTATGAVFNAGNEIFSETSIFKAMGSTNDKPSAAQLKKIRDSLTKMSNATITVDNSEEANMYNYPSFVYDGKLLPMERLSAKINGQIVESAVHLFREPPLLSFARERNQVTTIDIKLLQSPISKTDENFAIEDYLLERISHAKNGSGKKKILYKTLYEKADIKTSKKQTRAKEKVLRFMEHYKSCNFIKSFTMEKDGVSFTF